MARRERNWSKEFIEYTEYIAKHPNYKGLAYKIKKDGSFGWVAYTGDGIREERDEWWDQKVKEMNVADKAEVARLIHPKELNGMKPCQICGKKLSINYEYPAEKTLEQLNELSKLEFEIFDLTITEIFDLLYGELNDNIFSSFRKIFKIPEEIKDTKEDFLEYIHSHHGRKIRPGVMGNAPDRFDGFHSYNNCCRHIEDTGRSRSNLARYTQDRRAYENWADGNWNLANRLMGEFNSFSKEVICPKCNRKAKMTADHIGPISLGFAHRPKFNPLCLNCNSGKNNRMSYDDVKLLINDENNGETVISWHTKYLWDNLKLKVTNDNEAKKLSKIMREHNHKILNLFHIISSHNKRFLIKNFLNPEYSFCDYTFENFDPLNLDKLKIIGKPLDSKNRRKNAERYLRISFESLEKYADKENRNLGELDKKYDSKINLLTNELDNQNYKKALYLLNELIKEISDDEIKKF